MAVVIASSGIAATFLEGCRTAHLVLKLPLNLQNIEEPTCKTANTPKLSVLSILKIIIWNESTMAHKLAL